MANLKEVRERITSVKSTQQITKAMKMVSAAKLRKAQQAITEMRPYADQLDKMLRNIMSNLEGDASTTFGVEREIVKPVVVVVTSNRGLCGAFNTNVIKAAIKRIDTAYNVHYVAGNLTIKFIGKKGFDVLKKRYPNATLDTEHIDMFSDLSFDHVSPASQELMDTFTSTGYDRVDVAYGRFKNPGMQFPEVAQFLPVPKIETHGAAATKADYIFEPSKEVLLEQLIPSILQTQFRKYLLDTHASEHGARMTAMDKATENADDLLKELKINYNKARQEAITRELSEIVGGAAALAG